MGPFLPFNTTDETRDVGPRDRDETETFAVQSETRPRRDAIVFETSARPLIYLCDCVHTIDYRRLEYALC